MGNHLNSLGILLQPRVARAISSVLVLVFASACLVIANDLKKNFWDKQADLPSSSTEADIQKPAATKSMSARNINQWHLFGQAQKKKAITAATPITAPETKLNLKLNGIIASDGKNTAGAIIEKSVGNQEYFSIGDTISNGVTLKEVYKDRIILSRNGRLETLSLPKTSISTSHDNLKTAPVKSAPAPAPTTSLPKPSVSRDAKDTKKLLEKYREMVQQRQQRLNKK